MTAYGVYAPGSFLPRREPLNLDFSATAYAGLEVAARRAPLGLMRTDADVTEALGRALVSWNVEDGDGQPVTADLDGLMSQDSRFVAAVIRAWTEALAGAAA